MKIDRQYTSATERVAQQGAVAPGEVALDSDTGHTFLRITAGWSQIGTAGAEHILPKGDSAYPLGATPVTAGSGNVANAAAAATLPAVADQTTYVTGFEITGAGATVGLPVIATVTGLIGGTRSYIVVAAVGALVANTPVIVQFPVAIPANAVNTAIVISVPALGAGNTHSAVVIHGYQV